MPEKKNSVTDHGRRSAARGPSSLSLSLSLADRMSEVLATRRDTQPETRPHPSRLILRTPFCFLFFFWWRFVHFIATLDDLHRRALPSRFGALQVGTGECVCVCVFLPRSMSCEMVIESKRVSGDFGIDTVSFMWVVAAQNDAERADETGARLSSESGHR